MKSIMLNEKNCVFFYIEKAFGRVPKKMLELAMRKKGISELMEGGF